MCARDACIYTECYCEENVYHLLQTLVHGGHNPDQLFACFISNSSKSVPLFRQRVGSAPNGLVCWDYHVIVIEVVPDQTQQQQQQEQQHQQQQQPQGPTAAWVWDLDTTLPDWPCPFQLYAGEGLQIRLQLPPGFQRCYRLVGARAFLQRFASDRSHMRREDGSWISPPPDYPCIVAADGNTNTLPCYWDMTLGRLQPGAWARVGAAANEQQHGVVLTEVALLACLLPQLGWGEQQQQQQEEEEEQQEEEEEAAEATRDELLPATATAESI